MVQLSPCTSAHIRSEVSYVQAATELTRMHCCFTHALFSSETRLAQQWDKPGQ